MLRLLKLNQDKKIKGKVMILEIICYNGDRYEGDPGESLNEFLARLKRTINFSKYNIKQVSIIPRDH